MHAKDGRVKQEEFGLVELISFALKAAPFVVVFVSAAAAITYWRYNLVPSYTSDATLIHESPKSNRLQIVTDKLAGNQDHFDNPELVLDKAFILFQSGEFTLRVAEHLKRSGYFDEAADLFLLKGKKAKTTAELSEEIQNGVGLTKATSETFRMSISLPNAERAVRLLSLLVDVYPAVVSEKEFQELSSAKEFLQNQISDVEKRLAGIDEKISARQTVGRAKNSKFGLSTREAGTEQRIEQALFVVREQLDETRALLRNSERQAQQNGNKGFLPSDRFNENNSLEHLRRKEYLLNLRYKSTEKLLREIRALPDPRLSQDQEIQDLYKRKELEYQMFSDLKKEVMHVDLQRISLQSKIRVLDRPSIDEVRTGETLRPLMIKRCIFAAIFALLFTFFRETYNPAVRSRRDVAGLGLVFMGSIPDMTAKKRFSIRRTFSNLIALKKEKHTPAGRRITLDNNPYFNMVFQNICARILSFRSDNKLPPKVVSIISATSGEGKTAISRNLGRAFAKSGKRTLLVDCDFHRRSLSAILGKRDSIGLANYLQAPEATFATPVVQPIEKNLDFLSAGQLNSESMEMFTGKAFREFIDAMKHCYDVVLIDTPPALPCSEVIPLTEASDLVVMSVIPGNTKLAYLDEVSEKLRYSLSSPMCFVLNKHSEGNVQGYYHAYSKLHTDAPFIEVA